MLVANEQIVEARAEDCPGPYLLSVEACEVRVNQNACRRLAGASQSGVLPCLDIRDTGISDTTTLLKGEFPTEHCSNHSFSTHSLLLPNLLHAQPTCGLFQAPVGTIKATMRLVVANELFTSVGH